MRRVTLAVFQTVASVDDAINSLHHLEDGPMESAKVELQLSGSPSAQSGCPGTL